ncbi:MAG: MBL fold metallo-hydrolase [Acidimicrobiia bacterium]|nr:MBL fold metallo-hydrolase [Acidimicrobiia bacterium]
MKVFDLPVHRVSSWIFNCYLVGDDSDPLVAVDPGLPVVTERALALVRLALGRDPSDVTTIVSTHGHSDHVGGVADLQRSSGATALLPARCEQYLGGEAARTFPLVESSLRFMAVWGQQRMEFTALRQFAATGRSVGFGSSNRMRCDFDVGGYVADGDTLPGAPGWEVVHAPGHSDDSTCFYHPESATLLSGDAVVTHDGVAWFNPEYVDLPTANATEERLRTLEVRHLLPGHGLPVTAPDVWATARPSTTPPSGRSVLARCSRRFGRWG